MEAFAVAWIGKVKEYGGKPIPENYTIRELCFIWLYSSCLYECFNENSGISDEDWDKLTRHLYLNFQSIQFSLKYCIPRSCLEANTASGIPWEREFLCEEIFKNCEELVTIRKHKSQLTVSKSI